MTYSKAFALLNKMTVEVGIFILHIILDLFAQVTDDENEIFYTCFMQLVYNNTENRFSCKGDQRFGLCICMCGRSFVPAPATGIITFIADNQSAWGSTFSLQLNFSQNLKRL